MKKLIVGMIALLLAIFVSPACAQTSIAPVTGSLGEVPSLKALVIEQVTEYGLSFGSPGLVGGTRHIQEVFPPEIRGDLSLMSERIWNSEFVLEVSDPQEQISAHLTYFGKERMRFENGGEYAYRPVFFSGAVSFYLTKRTDSSSYGFPEDLEVQLRMQNEVEIELPEGSNLGSVKAIERREDGSVEHIAHLPIHWSHGRQFLILPAYYVEGEKVGELIFSQWDDQTGQQIVNVFDLGTGKQIEPIAGAGHVGSSIEDTYVFQDGERIFLDLPAAGHLPLVQLVVKQPSGRVMTMIGRLRNGEKEFPYAFKIWQAGTTKVSIRERIDINPSPGIWWIVPLFERYGSEEEAGRRFWRPDPPRQSVGIGEKG